MHASEPTGQTPHEGLPPTQRRELELELIRVRAAAEAARLEARAAEIELTLRQMCHEAAPPAQQRTGSILSAAGPSASPATAAASAAPSEATAAEIASWETMLQQLPRVAEPTSQTQATDSQPVDTGSSSPAIASKDAGQPVPAPHETPEPAELFAAVSALDGKPRVTAELPEALAEASEPEEATTHRLRRPAAWLVSTLAHVAVLVILAMVTLSIESPRDQIALSAAATDPREEPVETIELEQTEQPQVNPTSSSPEMVTVEDTLAEVATTAVDVTTPDTIAPAFSPAPASLGQSLGQSLSGGTSGEMASKFFGVAGGGNHFVYLVDNSGSMDEISRDGFDVARSEVLRAVDQLKEDQRFYVVFFGEKTLRMCLEKPNEPAPRSVYATAENKAALRRWAMTITMQPGRWPEEALQWAFELRPDCIFLLTDGEMSQRVLPLVREGNIVDTLIDGPKPRSIIHTVGFHNQSGEAQLKTIAKENGGSYRFVPATGNARR